MNVVVTNRKQYKHTAAIWWRCDCGCTYATVRAVNEALGVGDE